METVNFLAQLWGFSLIIICLSFLIKQRHVRTMFAVVEHESSLLFLGFANVVLGVASLLAFHAWLPDWTKIVTVLGWLLLAKGVFYLFAPETVVKMISSKKAKYMSWVPTELVIGVLLGCLLIYLGQGV